MKLWLISQNKNNDYDTYDSAVVAAKTEDEARMIHPSGKDWKGKVEEIYDSWVDSEDVKVQPIGIALPGTKIGVILASFHAG